MEVKGMEIIAASLGVYFCETTTAHTGKTARAIAINTDAVFTTLSLHGAGTTVNALTTQNLSGRTVSKGMVLYAPEGYYYSAITMSSGDCLIING